MPTYAYKAKSRSGKIVKGQINAPSKLKAKNTLYNKGLRPLSVKAAVKMDVEADTKGLRRFIYRDASGDIQLRFGPDLPSTKELAVFTKQFSLMVENGIPMISSLKLLENSQRKMTFKTIIRSIAKQVEKGSTLNEAVESFPQVFDNLYVAMVRAGEKSGQLDVILRQLVSYIEKAAKIKSQIKSAMTYPVIIIVVAIGVVALLLAFVVPAFAKQFKDSGQDLPELTQMVVNLSDFLVNDWYIILGTLIGSFALFRYWIKTESGRTIFDRFLLKAPIIGDVMTKIAIGRFSSTMSTMLSSGVPILDSLVICAASSGNKTVEAFVQGVKDEIEKGGNFYEPLQKSPMFPPLVSSMVEVGETTGKLDETLRKIAEIYEDEVDAAIETMTSMIEPILIVVIGSIVGFIVLAMYLPVFDLAGTVG